MTARRTGMLAIAALFIAVVGLMSRADAPTSAPVVHPIAAPPPRRTAPGVTTVRLVDERGRPVAGVPVWAGDGAMTFSLSEGHHNAGEPLGESDAEGLFFPDRFPVEINVAPWPAAPSSLTVADDGREHVLTVTEACPVELTWDDPGDPTVTEVTVSQAFSAPAADRHATLRLPCGTLDVGTRSRATPRVEPDPSQIDTREGSAHVSWREPDSVGICVTDEAGGALPEAEVGAAWWDGACWRYPGFGCATVRAPGFLDTEVCPDAGWLGWILDSYDVVLERGTDVTVRCEGGPCPARMGILTCTTDGTPDQGRCTTEHCTCPDDPNARVNASAGPYAGESVPVVNGVATFAHTGTATLVVRGPAEGALLSRVDADGDLLIGHIPADGVRRGLVAGTYRLMLSIDDGLVEWTGIRLEDGELREVSVALPDEEVEVVWTNGAPETAVFFVESAELRATWWRPPARVVPGATLVACVESGCCRFVHPTGTVTCTPDPAITPPVPW